jgi:Asp-tRNA(Asn)/Glu-tRNA(Gln) amidotransferase A subunit family amidase
MTALDLGSDLSGSLRQPAHTTGVFTLKPSFGVVPGRRHIPGPPGTLSSTDMAVLGPIGRTADDLDLALNVLAGPDEWSATAWQLLLPPADSNALFVNLLMAAVSPGTPDWNQTNERRQQLRARWQAFFRSFDVLLTPVSPVAAIAHDHTGDVFSGRPSRRYPGDRAVSGGPRGNRRRPPHRAPPRRIRRAADRFVGRRPTAAAVTAMRARQAAWRGRRPGRPGCRPWCRRRR